MRLDPRDSIAAAIAAIAALSAGTADVSFLIVGIAAGTLVGLGWPRLFGAQWRDASWPLGCAVAIPIFCVPLSDNGSSAAFALSFVLPAIGALPLASLLASRHANRRSADWLFGISVAITLAVAVLALAQSGVGYVSFSALPYLLIGLVALIPALGVVLDPASAPPDQAASRFTDRLALVALGATPGAAMTALPGSTNLILFIGWLVVLVIWRRFTIAPLLRLSVRSQKQRDLTVTAIEAERARIAADLHDDALQELTALVRRLDDAGDTEGADLARGVAERLRAICSDLRLPLLDDLGAGAALEWLVARIQPIAGGPVRLERIDEQRPPSGVELAVFRIAQEALANAVKHGRPPISVRYRVDESGHVSLSIDDVGAGIEPGAAEQALAAGHLGMANMQQRAELIGGLLDVRRWPAGGTHVALEWRPQ
jgi:signal transduction histidine kinase